MRTILDVTPITVGFDLRVQQIPIRVPADCAEVRYHDRTECQRTMQGSPAAIEAELRRVGYAVWDGVLELGESCDQLSACGDDDE